MEYTDYYRVLGVPKGADAKQIRSAYRKLARQLHPDHNPGDRTAEARFKQINEAHSVLSDPVKRSKYDELGADWERVERDQETARRYYSQGGHRSRGTTYTTFDSAEAGDFSDFFRTFFGDQGREARDGSQTSARRRAGAATAMADAEGIVEITLEEAAAGTKRLVEVAGRRFEVNIPAGVGSGSRVRVPGAAGPAGKAGGDLYLLIELAPHPRYRVEGADLHADLGLYPDQAFLGDEVRVETLAGEVSLKVPARSRNGRVIRLRGRGLKHRGGKAGDLLLRAVIDNPDASSAELDDAFGRLRAARLGGSDK